MLTKKNPLLYLKIAADGASNRMLHQVAVAAGTLIYHRKSQNAITPLQVSNRTLSNASSTSMVYWVPSASGSGFFGKTSKITFLHLRRTWDVFKISGTLEICTMYSLRELFSHFQHNMQSFWKSWVFVHSLTQRYSSLLACQKGCESGPGTEGTAHGCEGW